MGTAAADALEAMLRDAAGTPAAEAELVALERGREAHPGRTGLLLHATAGTERGTRLALASLGDADESVRLTAVKLVAGSGWVDAGDALREAMAGDPSPLVRAAAARAATGATDLRTERVLEEMARSDVDPLVRDSAARALAERAGREAPVLRAE